MAGPGRRFQKGQSGNPGGRSRAAEAIGRAIRERTSEGADLVEFAIRVWLGKESGMDSEQSRRWAHDWLANRGFGLPRQDVDVVVGTMSISPEQQAMIDALHMTPHERRERISEIKARMATMLPAASGVTETEDAD